MESSNLEPRIIASHLIMYSFGHERLSFIRQNENVEKFEFISIINISLQCRDNVSWPLRWVYSITFVYTIHVVFDRCFNVFFFSSHLWMSNWNIALILNLAQHSWSCVQYWCIIKLIKCNIINSIQWNETNLIKISFLFGESDHHITYGLVGLLKQVSAYSLRISSP